MQASEVSLSNRANAFSVKSFMGRYGIYVFLVLLIVIASVFAPAFLRPQNIKDILFLASVLGIVSIG